MSETTERIYRVLLVEDNPDDITVFKRAAHNNKHRCELQVVTNGETALNFLYQTGEWADAWRPDLVVLNVNLPKVIGWEVLDKIRSEPTLRTLPVVMWTIADSTYRDYASRSVKMGCSGGFTKPVDSLEAEEQVRAILNFHWWAWPHPYEPRNSAGVRPATIHALELQVAADARTGLQGRGFATASQVQSVVRSERRP